MRAPTFICAVLFLLAGLSQMGRADDLKVVLLDSKDGRPMHGKLVCIFYRTGDPKSPIADDQARECHRTDSTGTAEFAMPDPAPEKVKVELSTNNLMPCFASQLFAIADAMKEGMVAKNTCGGDTTDTTETGELVVYGHQKSVKEIMESSRNEF